MYNIATDQQVREILQNSRTIAVVGLSHKTHRDSYQVAQYMQARGYRIIPVNPRIKTVLGETAYPDLLSVPEKVDIVNIFRRSDQVPPIVDEALKINSGAVWMQLGIINDEAAEKCSANGVPVIMNKCIKVEHAKLLPGEV
ncbi:CoA-binding protein [Desulfoscipio gibsoniae]|uniref:Putative CoA-binding protein n=1 Tax=Desulfoscipio gibsoniae DSM 7213 TaxID=767817 RepID=R4KMT5_9FIRM|nr:CoA-binding protein [Desulfoscipio gibsoniae]AGL01860.1 putative CoA-binding protein [Desulfoscipio gibsoniae DSM 7213]